VAAAKYDSTSSAAHSISPPPPPCPALPCPALLQAHSSHSHNPLASPSSPSPQACPLPPPPAPQLLLRPRPGAAALLCLRGRRHSTPGLGDRISQPLTRNNVAAALQHAVAPPPHPYSYSSPPLCAALGWAGLCCTVLCCPVGVAAEHWMAYGSLPFVIPCLQPFTGEGREAAAVFTKPMPHSSEGSVATSGTLLAGELVQQQQQRRLGAGLCWAACWTALCWAGLYCRRSKRRTGVRNTE